MAEKLSISEEHRSVLERWLKGANTPQAVARRARIILMAAAGASNGEIARTVGVSRPTVIGWREEFAKSGVSRLTETKAGRGRKPQHSEAKVRRIVEATLQTKPKGAT